MNANDGSITREMNTDDTPPTRTDGGTSTDDSASTGDGTSTDTETSTDHNPNAKPSRSGRDVRALVNYAALAVLVLFALVASIQLYGAVNGVIDRWVASEYRIFFRGAFNLVVLLLCVGGISLQLRRLD
ncbi:hypothetical protein [Haloprofundus halobius]|uniref:hypothetical protein n=1 Tax=Haloprofundus halobius TaxID=2876194 RepID=UPI001CCBF15C|nr:hypothetical protein [Haloprofundus halobius]